MNTYVQLDRGTISEILYDYRHVTGDTEQLAEKYGIPETLITRIVLGN